MRIVYLVLLKDIAGGEIVCLQLMRAARERGHTVCILVPGSGSVMDAAQSEGFKAFILPLERTFQLHRAWALARFLRSWKADLIHTHTVIPGMVLARIGARLANVPIICHIHGAMHYSAKPAIRFLQRNLDNLTARFCEALIAVSKDTEHRLLATGKLPDKVIVIPNGVKLTSPANTQTKPNHLRFGIPIEHQLVGCVARLSHAKGQHVLLKAAAEILSSTPDVSFMFVGADIATDGHYEKELCTLAEQLGIAPHTHFVGFQQQAADLMPLFDVFALPSREEAMPLTILEAMAAGIPVVATRVNGIPEVVVEEETGFLVPRDDPHALASAILKLLRDPLLAHKMGQAGRLRVETHFNLDHLHERVFQLYEQAVEHNG
jgi:glycosyltransferase involved in cell wall biosynthesis